MIRKFSTHQDAGCDEIDAKVERNNNSEKVSKEPVTPEPNIRASRLSYDTNLNNEKSKSFKKQWSSCSSAFSGLGLVSLGIGERAVTQSDDSDTDDSLITEDLTCNREEESKEKDKSCDINLSYLESLSKSKQSSDIHAHENHESFLEELLGVNNESDEKGEQAIGVKQRNKTMTPASAKLDPTMRENIDEFLVPRRVTDIRQNKKKSIKNKIKVEDLHHDQDLVD